MKAYDILTQAALIAGETYLNTWWEDDGTGKILCDTILNLPTQDYLNKAWLYNFLLPERTGADNFRTAYQVSDYALAGLAYQLGDVLITEWRSRLTLDTTEVAEQATKYVAAQFLLCKDLDPQTLLDALNDALDEIGPITQYNTSLVTVADQEDYSLAQADEETVVAHSGYEQFLDHTSTFDANEEEWTEAPAGFARAVHAPVRAPTSPFYLTYVSEWTGLVGRTAPGCLHAYGPRSAGGVDEDSEAIWYQTVNLAAVVGHTLSAWFKGTLQSAYDGIPYPFVRIWYTDGTYTEALHTPASAAFDWVQVTATIPQSAAGKTVKEYQVGVWLANTGGWDSLDRDVYIDDASWNVLDAPVTPPSTTFTQAAATPVRNIVRVEVGQAASDPYGWQINRYWRESGASGTANILSFYADHAPSESGLPIRVWFNAPHPRITSMSDDILPEVYAPRLIWTTAYHAARRLARARTYDRERYADLLKQCDLRRQEMRVRYPTRNLVKDPEFTR